VYAPAGVNDREGTVGVPFVHAPFPPPTFSISSPLSSRPPTVRVPPRYIPQHKYASLPLRFPLPPVLRPLLPPLPSSRTPADVSPADRRVAWIHYTNYIDDTSMGHEIGGCFGCTDSAGTIFHLAFGSPSPLRTDLRSARPVFLSPFSVSREENNAALSSLRSPPDYDANDRVSVLTRALKSRRSARVVAATLARSLDRLLGTDVASSRSSSEISDTMTRRNQESSSWCFMAITAAGVISKPDRKRSGRITVPIYGVV